MSAVGDSDSYARRENTHLCVYAGFVCVLERKLPWEGRRRQASGRHRNLRPVGYFLAKPPNTFMKK